MKNKYLFRNRPRFWKSEKVRWTGTIIAVVLLITVFTVQNQEIWQNTQPDPNKINVGDTGQINNDIPTTPNTVPEPSVPETDNDTSDNTGNASITAVTNDELDEEAATVSTPPATWLPPSTGVFGRGFGYSYDSTHEDYRFHNGVDMPLEMGELVFAIADGKVIKVTSDSLWGGRVEIKHNGDLVSVYLGIVASGIKEGDKVQAGETIGTVGPPPAAETADGSHLHLQLLLDNKYVDPLNYLQ